MDQTNKKFPEFGGRFQTPVPKGETGISYHHRVVGINQMGNGFGQVPENRIGLDGKWDVGMGLWFEGAWINKGKNFGMLTNQQIITIGTDYTFGIGNGLNLIYEQFMMAYDEKVFGFSNYVTMSAISLAYPIGMFDNISTLVYYDWVNNTTYKFLNWKHQFQQLYFYAMVYMNPINSLLPQQRGDFNMFSGNGIQLMLVYNH